jgi:plasmid stability protein
MAEVLVRDLEPATVEKLKRRARKNHRSLQAELKQILESAAPLSLQEFRLAADMIRSSLKGRRHSDSVRLLREDRDR